MFRPFDDTPGRLAAYQYLEELIANRRVLEINCGNGLGLGCLLGLGARKVVGLEGNIDLARKALGKDRSSLRLRAWVPPRLPFSADSFDLVVLSDARVASAHPSLIEEVVRVLAAEGRVVFRSPSTDHPQISSGLSYGELLDLTEPHFDQVRVIGQSPFVGYSLVELTEEEQEPEVQLDGGLLEGDVEEVVAYVVVCGGPQNESFPYGVIQYPSGAQDDLAEAEPVVEVIVEPEPEPAPKTKAKPKAKPKAEPKAEPEAEPKAEPVIEVTTAPETPAEPEAKPVDLESYTDRAGGRLARWQWPHHLVR